MPAPSTLGTFLRAFTFGHVRQLDALLGQALERAWQAGAGPGSGRLVIDVDSFVGEVCGRLKQGAGYGYTQLLGYHPILATRADTREALHIRLRKGSANTQRGIERFTDELIARVHPRRRDRRQAAARRLRVLEHQGLQAPGEGGLAVLDRGADDQKGPRGRRSDRRGRLDEAIDYPDDGEAQIAETTLRRPAADRQAHPPARRPGRAVARLAPLLLPHQPQRGDRRSSRPSTATTPSSSR